MSSPPTTTPPLDCSFHLPPSLRVLLSNLFVIRSCASLMTPLPMFKPLAELMLSLRLCSYTLSYDSLLNLHVKLLTLQRALTLLQDLVKSRELTVLVEKTSSFVRCSILSLSLILNHHSQLSETKLLKYIKQIMGEVEDSSDTLWSLHTVLFPLTPSGPHHLERLRLSSTLLALL